MQLRILFNKLIFYNRKYLKPMLYSDIINDLLKGLINISLNMNYLIYYLRISQL